MTKPITSPQVPIGTRVRLFSDDCLSSITAKVAGYIKYMGREVYRLELLEPTSDHIFRTGDWAHRTRDEFRREDVNYQTAADYARDREIPEGKIDDLLATAPLCERAGCDEGPCAEAVKAHIHAAEGGGLI